MIVDYSKSGDPTQATRDLSNVGGTDLTVETFGQACHFDEERGEICQIVTNARVMWEDFSQKTLEMTCIF
jgi:protein involved in temperature-dependent protein secretion